LAFNRIKDKPTVLALDENGYATSKEVIFSGDGTEKPLIIQLDDESVYHIVKR